jgi:hypothetical protein
LKNKHLPLASDGSGRWFPLEALIVCKNTQVFPSAKVFVPAIKAKAHSNGILKKNESPKEDETIDMLMEIEGQKFFDKLVAPRKFNLVSWPTLAATY